MKTKHTQGEWEAVKNTLIPSSIMIGQVGGIKIADVSKIQTDTDEEAEANAKLIASAPLLLEFISRMVGEKNFIDNQESDEAILLIKKATE
jgi:hypothetical protein